MQNAKKDKGLYRNITKVNILYNKSDFYTIISLNFRLGDVRMKFKEFEYMRAIEAKKSITKAAQMLNVSQPAISRCLINLEKELGIQLFEKIDGDYVSTPAGKIYLEFAADITKRKIQFESDLKELLQYKQGALCFGITPGRSKSLTPMVLPEIRKNFPELKIEIHEENVHNLEEALRKGRIDVAFFTLSEQEKADDKYLYYQILGKEEIVLTVKKGTEIACKPLRKIGFQYPWVELSCFEKFAFILLKKNMRLGQIAEEILKENHISPEKIEIAGIETAQELVANGYGVCLCSSLGVREYQNRLDIYSFGKQPVTWKFVAALRVGGYMTEPLKYLIQLYQTAAERVQGTG